MPDNNIDPQTPVNNVTPIQKEDRLVQIKESELLEIIDKHRALDATYKLIEIILGSTEFSEMTQNIADTIPRALGYELGILALIDFPRQLLVKTAVSQSMLNTEVTDNAEALFEDLNIPLAYKDNLAIKAIDNNLQYVSEDFHELFRPTVTKEDALLIKELVGTKTNVVTPLYSKDKPIGVLIVSMSKTKEQITDFEKHMLIKFSENAGIAIENAKLFSKLKTAKEDLNKAYENLKFLNKMKDEFLTVASHELRTPMTIIKSYLWMLQNEKAGKLNEKQIEYLEKAINGTARMINLINDMLDISKFEQKKVTFKYEQVDIVNLIKEVIDSFIPKVEEKKIYIKLFEDYPSIYVNADQEKTREILVNLIGNSVKFTDDGGVTVGIDELDKSYKVWVKDTGPGINPKDLPKLFNKFARIENSYTVATEPGGTGLGLYIVKLYAEGMGGDVGGMSEGLGKGSTFWATFPKEELKRSRLKQVDIPGYNPVTPKE